MTDKNWELWGTDEPTGRTIWQRSAPSGGGEITGNNSGKGAVETEIRAPDGTILLNTTDSFSWEYWGGVHVTLNPDGETAILDVNNKELDTWRLATPEAPQKLLESWRIVDDDSGPTYHRHPDGWRAEAKVLRRKSNNEVFAPVVGQIKITDPSGATALDQEVTLLCDFPPRMQATISEDAAQVEVRGNGEGAGRVTLQIPRIQSNSDTE